MIILLKEAKEFGKWLERAEKDLNSAKITFKDKLFDVSAFLCQQAVEKALKAMPQKVW